MSIAPQPTVFGFLNPTQNRKNRVARNLARLRCAISLALDWNGRIRLCSAIDGKRYGDQTVSELSSIGAPTYVWMVFGAIYGVFALAFAVGAGNLLAERARCASCQACWPPKRSST
jgi:hypothetical protein